MTKVKPKRYLWSVAGGFVTRGIFQGSEAKLRVQADAFVTLAACCCRRLGTDARAG